jgi:hypothetical protein
MSPKKRLNDFQHWSYVACFYRKMNELRRDVLEKRDFLSAFRNILREEKNFLQSFLENIHEKRSILRAFRNILREEKNFLQSFFNNIDVKIWV